MRSTFQCFSHIDKFVKGRHRINTDRHILRFVFFIYLRHLKTQLSLCLPVTHTSRTHRARPLCAHHVCLYDNKNSGNKSMAVWYLAQKGWCLVNTCTHRTLKVLRSGYFCFCRLPVNKIYPDTGISISANLYIHSALIVCNEKKYSLNKWLLVSLFDSFVQTASCVFYSSNSLYWLSILLLSLLSLHKISSAQQTYFLVYSLFGMWLLITART